MNNWISWSAIKGEKDGQECWEDDYETSEEKGLTQEILGRGLAGSMWDPDCDHKWRQRILPWVFWRGNWFLDCNCFDRPITWTVPGKCLYVLKLADRRSGSNSASVSAKTRFVCSLCVPQKSKCSAAYLICCQRLTCKCKNLISGIDIFCQRV